MKTKFETALDIINGSHAFYFQNAEIVLTYPLGADDEGELILEYDEDFFTFSVIINKSKNKEVDPYFNAEGVETGFVFIDDEGESIVIIPLGEMDLKKKLDK